MPTITVQLETPVRRSFRVEQVAGMFDVPRHERVRHELVAEVPGLEEKWTIGAIVGPSGSGKTTLARAAFGKGMFRRRVWPKDRAIIDCFGDVGVKELMCVLASVGLGSPPTWLKPYRVLSTGEKFRADLLRAMVETGRRLTQRREGAERSEGGLRCARAPSAADGRPLREDQIVVVDEFTSSLDRTIAKTTSAALARMLRGETVGRRSASLSHPTVRWPRFVAVTCHRDILPWLNPDWVLELGGEGGERLSWPAGRPPHVRIRVERVPQAVWTRFSGQHYLSGGLAASATCYAAMWNQEPIGFCAVAAALGWKATKRIQRLVVLPEFQGLGIGGQLLDQVAAIEAGKGNRVTITASHPAVLAHCERSERWQLFAVKKDGSTRQRYAGREVSCSVGRAVAAFEWVGTSADCGLRSAECGQQDPSAQVTAPGAQVPVPSAKVAVPTAQEALKLSARRRRSLPQLSAEQRVADSSQKNNGQLVRKPICDAAG